MDEYTHLALWLQQELDNDLAAASARVEAWEPAEMPKDWR